MVYLCYVNKHNILKQIMNTIMETETVNLKAFVYNDKKAGVYTVALEGTGGPIVSAPTHEEACAKFTEALALSCAVQNLIIFKEAVKNASMEGSETTIGKSKKPEIEFVELEVA